VRSKAVPRPQAIDDLEQPLEELTEYHVSQGHLFAEPVAEAMRGACAVGRLARPVDVAERAERAGRMPGIERDLLDQPLAGAAVRRVDVLLGDRQPRHRNRRRDLLGPLDRSILDRWSRRVA